MKTKKELSTIRDGVLISVRDSGPLSEKTTRPQDRRGTTFHLTTPDPELTGGERTVWQDAAIPTSWCACLWHFGTEMTTF